MEKQKVKARRLEMGLRERLELNALEDEVNKEDIAKRNYIKYTEQDKKNALTHMLIENMSVKGVSDKLNINCGVLYRWKSEKIKSIVESNNISSVKLNNLLQEKQKLNKEKQVLLHAHSILFNSIQ